VTTLILLTLLACKKDDEHPEVREGEQEHDPGVPPTGGTTDPSSGGTSGSTSTSGGGTSGSTGGTSGSTTGGTTTGGSTTGGTTPATAEVCYPGEAEDYSACIPVVDWSAAWGSDYSYPSPYEGSAQYSEPERFIDLTDHSSADPSLRLAPNFALDELMQEWKGDYAIYQVHAIEYLQVIRDAIGGGLTINSGYRNVSYNASVGGAEYSRHLYGDAADMASGAASLEELGGLCDDLGAGYVGYYETHVHCDWRDDTLDKAFYDPSRSASGPRPAAHSAWLEFSSEGWMAPAEGFDEGEPLRWWTAFDETGAEIDRWTGRTYLPPVDAAVLEVEVGGQVVVTRRLE